jgi:hypothetical protein
LIRSGATLLLLAAGLLAGCQAAAPARPTTAVAPGGGVPAAAPSSTQQPSAAALDRDDLRGLDQAALQQHLGRPSLSRVDGDALVLAYRRGDCVLHLFLYPDAAGERRVRHADAIGSDRRRRPVGLCLS